MQPANHFPRIQAPTGYRRYLGLIAFGLVASVVALHLSLPFDDEYRFLFSAQPVVEGLGTAFLLLAPPFAVVLAMRYWMATGRAVLSLITVAFGSLLTVLTLACVVVGAFS